MCNFAVSDIPKTPNGRRSASGAVVRIMGTLPINEAQEARGDFAGPQFALPNRQDAQPRRTQRARRAANAPHITVNLSPPELAARRGSAASLVTSVVCVPKASVHKDRG